MDKKSYAKKAKVASSVILGRNLSLGGNKTYAGKVSCMHSTYRIPTGKTRLTSARVRKFENK